MRNKSAYNVKIIITILILFSTVQCENPLAEERRNIICFVDLSASVSQEQKNNYSKAIEEILKSMSANDRIVCYPIDAGSYSNPIKIFNEDFKNATESNISFPEAFKDLPKNVKDSILPPFIKENETVFDETKQSKRIQEYVNHIIPFIKNKLENVRSDKMLSKYSDILHCVLNSEKDIEESDSYSLKVTNYFIFLSDMIHDDGIITFDKPYGISRDEGEKVLQNLKSTNLIPDLKKSKIIIIGRSTGSRAKTPEALENIRTFWEEYFSPKYANGSDVYYAGADAISDIPKLLQAQ